MACFSPQTINNLFSSSLVKAIENGNNLEIIKQLVENGASVNDRDFLQNPLDAAIDTNNAEIVNYLLTQVDHDINDKRPSRRETLLHRACEAEYPSIDIVRGLLEHGIDVNADNQYGETALHIACQTGNKAIVQLLIDYSIDINYVDEYSDCASSAIYYAISSVSEQIFLKIFELLLKEGAEVFTVSSTNISLLNAVLEASALKIAKILLRHIVNLSSQIEINWNKLSCAVFDRNINLTKELIQNGHELDMLCLYAAVARENTEIFELIWNNIAPDVVSHDLYFMINIFDNWKSNDEINKLWLLLNKEGVDLHLDRCGKAFAFFIYRWAPDVFGEVNKTEHSALLECLVKRGLRLSASDAELIIHIASNPANVQIIEDIINIALPKITTQAFRNGVETKLDKFLIQYCLDSNFDVSYGEWDADFIQYYLGLFTVMDNEKKFFICTFERLGNIEDLDRVTMMLDKMNVKSLVELSRDAMRKQLNEICRDSRHLLYILDKLQLPTIIRNIIQCKEPVNHYVYSST